MKAAKPESCGDDVPCLEVVCSDCDGEGGFSDNPPHDFTVCSECNGAGYVPTDAGKKVLALMRHNFKPMARMLSFGLAN
jgi:DnaJ-class molecular chaperone